MGARNLCARQGMGARRTKQVRPCPTKKLSCQIETTSDTAACGGGGVGGILANDLCLLVLVRVNPMLSLSVGTAALARPQAQAMVQASALPCVGKMLPCNRVATVVFSCPPIFNKIRLVGVSG